MFVFQHKYLFINIDILHIIDILIVQQVSIIRISTLKYIIISINILI